MRQFCHWIHSLTAFLLLSLPSSRTQQAPPQDGVCVYTNKTSTQVPVPVVVSTRGRYCDWWSNCRYYISYRTTYILSTKNITISGQYCCPGYRPQDGHCLLGCAQDRWGANCAELCTCNVTTQTCDDVTGTCFCRPGFESGDCQVPGGSVGGQPSDGKVAAIVLVSLLLLVTALLLLILLLRRSQHCRSQGKHKQRPTVPQRPAGHNKNTAYDSGRGSLAEGEVEMVSHADLDLTRGATPAGPGDSTAGRESLVYQHLHQPAPRRDGACNQLYHHLAPPPAHAGDSGQAQNSRADFEEVYDVARFGPVIGTDSNATYHQLHLPPS